MLLKAVSQLLGTERWFLQFWELGELNDIEEIVTVERRKRIILEVHHEVTCIINVPSSDCKLPPLKSRWFKVYVCS